MYSIYMCISIYIICIMCAYTHTNTHPHVQTHTHTYNTHYINSPIAHNTSMPSLTVVCVCVSARVCVRVCVHI